MNVVVLALRLKKIKCWLLLYAAGCRSNKFYSFGYGMNIPELFTFIQLLNILLAPLVNRCGLFLLTNKKKKDVCDEQ